jgi:hypothetical protein
MDVEEVWAYRSSRKGLLHPVRILDLGVKARIEFEEMAYEGRRQWVPRSHLRVLWSGVDAYVEDEARWEAVDGDDVDPDEYLAAEVVFEELVPSVLAELRTDGYKGVADVSDMAALSRFAGLSVDILESLPAFEDVDGWHMPWGTTEAVARTVAGKYPDRLLIYIETLQSKYRSALILGEDAEDIITGREYRRPPEKVQQMYAKYEAPLVSILEAWIGKERVAERADIAGLQRELTRVAGVADRAITALQARSMREGQGYRDELEDQLRPFDFEMMLDDRQRQRALAEVREYFWRNQQSALSPQQPRKTTAMD